MPSSHNAANYQGHPITFMVLGIGRDSLCTDGEKTHLYACTYPTAKDMNKDVPCIRSKKESPQQFCGDTPAISDCQDSVLQLVSKFVNEPGRTKHELINEIKTAILAATFSDSHTKTAKTSSRCSRKIWLPSIWQLQRCDQHE